MSDSSRAIVDVANIETEEQLRQALTFAGVEESGHSGDLLAIFKSTESFHPDDTVPGTQVGIWACPRTVRNHNPFHAGVYHVLGACPAFDPEMVRSTIEHLQTGLHLYLEEVLNNDCELENHLCRHSDEREGLVTKLEGFCDRLELKQHLRETLVESLDELLTNALYNAPVEAGVPRANTLRRRLPIAAERPVTVQFGADDQVVAVAVADEYGSLTPNKVLGNLSRCYGSSLAQVSSKERGAGIGLFMLLQNSSRLIINISEGIYSQVLVVRNRNESRRKFAGSAPTLNICTRMQL